VEGKKGVCVAQQKRRSEEREMMDTLSYGEKLNRKKSTIVQKKDKWQFFLLSRILLRVKREYNSCEFVTREFGQKAVSKIKSDPRAFFSKGRRRTIRRRRRRWPACLSHPLTRINS
jgi:hypothetical protein